MERLKNFLKTFFCGDGLKNFCEDLFFFFGDRQKNFCEDLFFYFWRALALVSLASRVSVLGKAVLGLVFFCVLGLEPCVLYSTSD